MVVSCPFVLTTPSLGSSAGAKAGLVISCPFILTTPSLGSSAGAKAGAGEDWVGQVREQGRALASEMAALKAEAKEKAARLAVSAARLALSAASFLDARPA